MTFQFVVIPKSLSSYEYKKKARETKKREKKNRRRMVCHVMV